MTGDPNQAGSAPRFRDRAARQMNGPAVVPPYPSRVDLHAHSCRSDGVLEPRALVNAAAAVGVRILALADHDTLAGVRELFRPDERDAATAAGLPLEQWGPHGGFHGRRLPRHRRLCVTEGFGCGRERPERSDLADQP